MSLLFLPPGGVTSRSVGPHHRLRRSNPVSYAPLLCSFCSSHVILLFLQLSSALAVPAAWGAFPHISTCFSLSRPAPSHSAFSNVSFSMRPFRPRYLNCRARPPPSPAALFIFLPSAPCHLTSILLVLSPASIGVETIVLLTGGSQVPETVPGT